MDVHFAWNWPTGWEDLEGKGKGAGGYGSRVPGRNPSLPWFPKGEEKLRTTHPHCICHSNGFPFPHPKISFPRDFHAYPRITFPLFLEPLT